MIIALASFLYYALSLYALYIFNAGILVTSIVLFGLPALVLAHFSAASRTVLASVATFGAGIAIMLEGAAHIYGIWYTLGIEQLRIFGIIPLEGILASILQTLFLVLLYELLFDDGEYVDDTAHARFIAFGVFAAAVLLLVGIHTYAVHTILLSHSYLWLLGIFIGSTLAALAASRALTVPFFKRLFYFTLVACVPLFIALFLAVTNTQKIFAYTNDYLYTFKIFGNILPIEEVILTLVLPMFVATFYEMYLDDGKLKTSHS